MEVERQVPLSPRDTTPIVINGQEVDRSLLNLGDEPIVPVPARTNTPVTPIRPQSTPRTMNTKKVTVPSVPITRPCVPPRPVVVPPQTSTQVPVEVPVVKQPEPPSVASPPIAEKVTPTAPPPVVPSPTVTSPQPSGGKLTINLNAIPDYSRFSPQYCHGVRTWFRSNFGDMRETYPEYEITTPPDSMPLEEVHAIYLTYMRNIKIMEKVTNYKVIMYIVWWGFEKAMTWYFKIDISGFTDFHYKQIRKYQFSLRQMAEQSLDAVDGNVDPRWNMIWIFGIQAVFFMGMKFLGKFFNEDTVQKLIQVFDDLINGGGRVLRNGAQRVQRLTDGQGHNIELPQAPRQHYSPDPSNLFGNIISSIFTGGGGNNQRPPVDTNQQPPFSE